MAAIRRGDKSYFIGLSWNRLYMEKKVKAEVDGLVSAIRNPVGVLRLKSKDSPMENHVGFTGEALAMGMFSGAAVLANCIDQGLLVEKVAEDLYWVVLISEHSVVAGTDVVLKEESVAEKVREVLGNLSSDSVPIYMSEASAANLPMFENFVPLDFLGLIESTEQDPHKKDVRIGKLKKAPITTILGMVFLVSSAAGLYWYLNAPATPVVDPAAMPALAPRPELAEPGMTDEMRQQARVEEAGWLYQQSLLSPNHVVSALNHRFARLPLSVGGWNLTSMKYDATSPEAAQVTYRRTAMGSPYSLTSGLALDWTFSPVADEAVAQVEIPVREEEPPADVIGLLNSNDHRWLDFLDAVQRRGLNITVADAMETDRPKPIAGLPDSMPEATKRQLTVRQKNFAASGTGWLSATTFGRAVQPLSFIAVKTVEITVADSALNWTINGEVYEHAE